MARTNHLAREVMNTPLEACQCLLRSNKRASFAVGSASPMRPKRTYGRSMFDGNTLKYARSAQSFYAATAPHNQLLFVGVWGAT
jgi:hypothetical protein